MEDNRNLLIDIEGTAENEDKENETHTTETVPDEEHTAQIQEPPSSITLTIDDGTPNESSTDPSSGDAAQNSLPATSSPTTNQIPQTSPPGYVPWQCIDAYRPRPMPTMPSDRPPIPRGIPPPPYQGLQLGPIPTTEQQSLSDEPPPEYPGPPRVFSPPEHAPIHYPPGSRLAQALEQERRREIGRLIVLSAVMNTCEERSRRNAAAGRPAPRPGSAPNSRGRPTTQSADTAAKSRKNRMLGAFVALGVFVVFFTIIGIVLKNHHDSKKEEKDYYNTYKSYDYGYHKSTTRRPGTTCGSFYCLNGGRCEDRFTDARCVCTGSYYGTHCQINKYDTIWKNLGRDDNVKTSTLRPTSSWSSSVCLFNWICQNGGTCMQSDWDMQYCICPRGYSGKYCQVTY